MPISPCPVCSSRLESLISCSQCGADTPKPGIHLQKAPCPACGHEAEVKFQCPDCGSLHSHDLVHTEEEEATAYACPFCGAFVSEAELSCPSCGARFIPEEVIPQVPRRRRRKKGEYAEEEISELLRIPGIGRSRAEVLCEAGYTSIAKLMETSVEELSGVKQLGPKVAESIKQALETMEEEPPAEEAAEEAAEVEFECPACGIIVSAYASSCFECGTVFETEPLDEAMKVELEHVGEEASSLAFFDMKILEEPSDPHLWFSRANLLREMGKLEEALESFNKVIELRPDDRRAYIAKADILTQLDRFHEAAEAYRAIIATPLPETPEAVEEAALEALLELEEEPCPHCGEPVLSGTRICPSCGAEIRPPLREVAEGEIPEVRALEELDRLVGPQPPSLDISMELPPGRPVGLINGVSLVNGRGRVNGQIDRKGFINGSELSETTLGRRRSLAPRYVAVALSLLLLFALTVPLLPPAPAPALSVTVNGDPSDWEGVQSYSSAATTGNPDVDLATYALTLDDGYLFFLARVRGAVLGDLLGLDAAMVFLDSDGDAGTGYAAGDLGADYLLQVYGGEGDVVSAGLRGYAASGDVVSRTNWTAWENHGPILAAAAGGTLEMRVDTFLMDVFDAETFTARILLDDQQGNATMSERIGKNAGALRLSQSPQGDVIVGRAPSEVVAELDATASGVDVTLQSIDLEISGARVPAEVNRVVIPAGSTSKIQVRVDTTTYSPGDLLDISVVSATATGSEGPVPVTLDGLHDVVFVESAPQVKAVDGWFGDWDMAELNRDDVSAVRRPGLDVDAFGSNQTGNLGLFYLGFKGTAMVGDPLPVFRAKAPPPSPGGPSSTPAPIVTIRRGAEDVARIYIDSNSSDNIGTQVVFGSQRVQADHVLTIKGVLGQVTSTTLHRWQGRWQEVPGTGIAQSAVIGAEMEASVDLAALSSVAELNATEYLVATTDWRGRGDQAFGGAPWGTRGGTRTIYEIQSTTNVATTTAYSQQRKLFYDGSNYWAFYYDGTQGNTYFEYSSDGTSWTSTPVAAFTTTGVKRASVWYHSSSPNDLVYLVGDTGASDTSVIVREGSISGTSITWSSEVTVTVSDVAMSDKTAFIMRDAAGYIWIASSANTAAANTWNVTATRSSSTGSITTWDSQTNLGTGISSSLILPEILPVGTASDSDVYAVWYRGDNGAIEGKFYENSSSTWSGTTDSVATANSADDSSGPSAVVEIEAGQRVIHLIYIDTSAYVQYSTYTTSGTSSTWAGGPAVDTTATNVYPTVSLDTSTGYPYAFYLRGNQLYCKYYDGSSWTAITLTTNTAAKSYPTSVYSWSNNDFIALEWRHAPGTTYDIYFEGIPEFPADILPAVLLLVPILIIMRRLNRPRRRETGDERFGGRACRKA